MWQKIKCWLGWHEWVDYEHVHYILYKETRTRCKHCGKVKR